MREPRNPFRLRASEHIESDATFLRLFGPGVLELFPNADELWDRPLIIRSAPGGGKTSLLRLFTPSSLLTLHAYRSGREYTELFERMKALGMITDAGPRVLGVMVSCARTYATLADMDLDQARKDRLFLTLLNARIILATLRGALVLKRLSYPEHLDRLKFNERDEATLSARVQFPETGAAIYKWAKDQEAIVCSALDSFGTPKLESPLGTDDLSALALMRPEHLSVDGEPVADRILVMFDDLQKLTYRQREKLVETIVEMRSPVAVWIAERFEALSVDELLSSGATQGRDYERVLALEKYWRDNRRRFESLVTNIADRRAGSAADVEIGPFSACLEATVDGADWEQEIAGALNVVSDRVRRAATEDPIYGEWVASREEMQGTPRERLLAWRAAEILIEREKSKSQARFDFAPLQAEALNDSDESDVRHAAELFLAREFKLPYYFGISKLAMLASANIEQFLWLAGDEFEEIVASVLVKRGSAIAPDRQQAVLLKAAKTKWAELPRGIRNGGEVRMFLEAVGAFAQWMTYQPNAPYSPGITGIGISMAERDVLRSPITKQQSSPLFRLSEVLSSAIAHNLLEPILHYKCKGESWMVLYLNRLLCLHFGLPLQYGGWKEKPLAELVQWMEKGFNSPNARTKALYE